MKTLVFAISVLVVLFFVWKLVKLLFLPFLVIGALYLIFKRLS